MHSILQKLGTKSRVQSRRTSGFTGRDLVELYFYHVWRETHAVNFAELPESLAFNFSSLLCFYPRTPCEYINIKASSGLAESCP
jgi:hypothetical protein